MCGRYRVRRLDLLQLGLRAQPQPEFEEFTERPHLNVAPPQRMPLLRMSEEGTRELALARWGFIPSWARELPKLRPINARSETVPTNGMFRGAFAKRRCLLPADGFYEWQKIGKTKQPFLFRLVDDRQFCLAGLWERWKPLDGEAVDTFTILTTGANEMVAPIHNRMPMILLADQYEQWLDIKTPPEFVKEMMKPFGDRLDCSAISSLV